MLKKQRHALIKRLIQRKKEEKIKDSTPAYDYDKGYQRGFITALELLLEENLI